jgi:hypothetical protein
VATLGARECHLADGNGPNAHSRPPPMT